MREQEPYRARSIRFAKETAMKVVKAATIQLSPVLYSREGMFDKVVQTIHELGRQAVQFATFLETTQNISIEQGLDFITSYLFGPEQYLPKR
jgi:nitrilase